MNTRYLEKDGPVMDREDFTISGDPSGPNYINMWRARLPGEPTSEPMPMLCATTTPTELMGDKYDEDKLNAGYRTYIWFNDRESWEVAYRWTRKIARGGRLDGVDEVAAPRLLKYEIAACHWDAHSERRVVQLKGVKFKRQLFTAPVLVAAYPGSIVLVRPDQKPPSVISVFTTDGKLICRAESRPEPGGEA